MPIKSQNIVYLPHPSPKRKEKDYKVQAKLPDSTHIISLHLIMTDIKLLHNN